MIKNVEQKICFAFSSGDRRGSEVLEELADCQNGEELVPHIQSLAYCLFNAQLNRCKCGFAHAMVASSVSASVCKFARMYKKQTQARQSFCFHMPQLGWLVPIFCQSKYRCVSMCICIFIHGDVQCICHACSCALICHIPGAYMHVYDHMHLLLHV